MPPTRYPGVVVSNCFRCGDARFQRHRLVLKGTQLSTPQSSEAVLGPARSRKPAVIAFKNSGIKPQARYAQGQLIGELGRMPGRHWGDGSDEHRVVHKSPPSPPRLRIGEYLRPESVTVPSKSKDVAITIAIPQ